MNVLLELTEKSLQRKLTKEEQELLDKMWPYCSVNECDNRIKRNGNGYYCSPHLSQILESGVN